ncbi:hypothetical protein Moror_10117 [Moniliophthora roreri MCA 2997]|uniref:Uncharacterized protein n=2 Tax=Moniliophthora roreri TaxID=221103 RepID=V2WZ53_MONRO|nr:hypothetical protein Moror_10117 [Moniliophthora roreri MCA 2997]KAI3606120.1 hypothetical protein WG66_003996 [Moniliophthora roreri]
MSTDSEPYVDPAAGDHRMLIAGLVLGFLGIIAVGIIVFWTLRLKIPSESYSPETLTTSTSNIQRQASMKSSLKRKATGRLLDRNHIAAKITPFGHDTSQDARTGENMRIATRLPNGAWSFTESGVKGSLTIERVEEEVRSVRASMDMLRGGAASGYGGDYGGSLVPGFGLPPPSPSVESSSYHTVHTNHSQVPLLNSDIPDSRLTLPLDSTRSHEGSTTTHTTHTSTYNSKAAEAAHHNNKWMEEPDYVEMPPPAYGSSPAYHDMGYGAGYGGWGTGFESQNQNQREEERERDRWR